MNRIKCLALALGLTLTPVAASTVEAGEEAAMHANREKLEAHTAEFEREVIRVTDGVHVAVGFGLANSILIEGDDGVIIVDTMESIEAARDVKAEFDRITDKPVRAIIYTHNHTDHIMGATVFAGDDQPDVYSHETTTAEVENIYKHITGAIFSRSVRQFGVFLSDEDHLNCGIGPRLRVGPPGATGFIPANRTFSDEMETEIAGIRLKLVHAPGETDDQLYVWLPDKGVLLPGDNFYKAFPNLYAIRGTSYRDVRHWADSLDLMIAEAPEFLVPSHSRPISGAAQIAETLGNYRDAIRFVHDETVAGLNRGLTPDQLVETVKLPDHLAALPYLQEYYGTVAWSVRSIFNGYLGWFDGNATNLFPLSPKERASRMAELAGGEDALRAKAAAAFEAGDFQWCAELADLLIALSPGDAEAKRLRAGALRELGERQISANGRNYYLTSAQQTR
jgi:alkyl sulfatase BDS1-like metallo-beta-lactamase superfamily hydrolase